MRSTHAARPTLDDPAATTGIGRFESRAFLGWLAVLLGAVPFLLLWLLVQRSWAPLSTVDGDVAADLNATVRDSPALVGVLRAVTSLGDTGTAVLLFVLATLFLIIRQQRRLAAFTATTGVGLAVLGPLTKAIVDRARPVVESPVVETPSNASFPSGHAMTALVTYGLLLMLALPAVRRSLRPWLVAGTALVVVAVGFTRLALGVHFVSDVLAGWALGAGWLAVTAASFRAWQHSRGVDPREPLDPLDIDPGAEPHLAAEVGLDRQQARAAALRLLAVAAGIFALVTALGLLVTVVLADTWLGRFDRAVVGWFVGIRSSGLTTVMEWVSGLSGTPAVIAVGLTAAVLGLAVTARWQPAVFVAVTLGGEVALYFFSAQVVSRTRPAVADLTSNLPSGASWPSGHAAAAAALYGAVAALVIAYHRGRWRWAVLALPLLLAPAIAVSRIYVAAHYPTDVLAGLLLGGLWVYCCARLVLPRGDHREQLGTRPAPVRPGAVRR
ncbi:undecaprenyl-diphosphatase [Blastococcus aggregatus]|uniref:Undecaprenyl-diphosphatase n=1 Tax=Blastococcus aggregatus TaxID=38502 RepID=A0A285V7F4_9ACTN|nr:phosphatase PAP2 family protein [Blastococcus aggregatus]SOC50055.1 undecaprenyl-diphosphatase [Blastococcus aggregatus]